MNVNDMIDTILNFDLDVVLAGLNESSHHLSQMEFVSLIVITVGAVLLCLTGLKLVRGTCIGGAWCMEEADWWICDCSGTRLCCQCTFDETTGFYYVWNLCGYWSCVCIAFY